MSSEDPGPARRGDHATVAFVGRLEDGTVFDRTPEGESLTFELGSPETLPGFWRGCVDLVVGQTTSFTVPPELAFGERDERRIRRIPRKDLPEDASPGSIHRARADQVDLVLRLERFEGDEAVMDGNPPHAGQTLSFEVTLLGLERPGTDV